MCIDNETVEDAMELWPKTAKLVKKRAIQRHKYFIAAEKDMCKDDKNNLKSVNAGFAKSLGVNKLDEIGHELSMEIERAE